MTDTDRKVATYGGAALAFLVVVELVNKRQLLDVIVLVLMALVVIVMAVYYLLGRGRSRGWTKAVRSSRWAPYHQDWQGQDAIVMRRVAEHGDRSEDIEQPRLFKVLPNQTFTEAGIWEAEFAELWGQAENRATVLNASVHRKQR